MHGNGTLMFPDGRVYEGCFINGRQCGHGVVKVKGENIKGKFLDGLMVSVWSGSPAVLKEVDQFSAESISLPETPPTCRP
jgi:hypothetical protein